jgi:hypothetical protein
MGKVKGIEITDLTVGTGAEAAKDSCVAANVRMFLRRGDEVSYSPMSGPRMVIDLGRRECIAGLRYGIPGMRVGGVRQIIIPPHLAYGEAGIPGEIPPNALLRCNVELLEIRTHSAFLPQDHLPGKLLMIRQPDKTGEPLSGWHYMIHENGNASLSFARKLRDTGRDSVQFHRCSIALDPQTSANLIRQALEIANEDTIGRLPWERAYVDQTGFSVTDCKSGTSCIVIYVTEQGERVCIYAVPEDNEAFLGSEFYGTISLMVDPHLGKPTVTY